MRLLHKHPTSNGSQTGFTIVELMIATMVFSTVLLIITYGVMEFTRGYYKGINSSTTQTTTQDALDTITQAIQFSNADPIPPPTPASSGDHFCAGNKIFMYTLGRQPATPGPGNWGLYVANNNTPACPALSGQTPDGQELLTGNMRLAYVSIGQPASTAPWQVHLSVAYGSADLLCQVSIHGLATGSCQPGATSYQTTDPVWGTSANDVECKGQTGSQFCAVSALSDSVEKRLN